MMYSDGRLLSDKVEGKSLQPDTSLSSELEAVAFALRKTSEEARSCVIQENELKVHPLAIVVFTYMAGRYPRMFRSNPVDDMNHLENTIEAQRV